MTPNVEYPVRAYTYHLNMHILTKILVAASCSSKLDVDCQALVARSIV